MIKPKEDITSSFPCLLATTPAEFVAMLIMLAVTLAARGETASELAIMDIILAAILAVLAFLSFEPVAMLLELVLMAASRLARNAGLVEIIEIASKPLEIMAMAAELVLAAF